MKRNAILTLTAILLLLSFLLSACGGSAPETTSAPAPTGETKSEVKTEEKGFVMPQMTLREDDDDTLDILMIGNSFCTYYPDELFGLLEAAGIKARVCSVYYSGCSVSRHWDSLVNNNKIYTLYTQTGNIGGRREAQGGLSLLECLAADEHWDVISLQQHFGPLTALTLEECRKSLSTFPRDLFSSIKTLPCAADAAFLWHQTWAYQVGYQAPAGQDPSTRDEKDKVLSVETQTTGYENIRQASWLVCEESLVPIIPCGDAWQIARQNPLVGDTLCNKADGTAGDYYHDGEAGGQYLNACVWFEVLTKQSSVGNTFKPHYKISEEVRAALQTAAHEAVVAVYGEGYFTK